MFKKFNAVLWQNGVYFMLNNYQLEICLDRFWKLTTPQCTHMELHFIVVSYCHRKSMFSGRWDVSRAADLLYSGTLAAVINLENVSTEPTDSYDKGCWTEQSKVSSLEFNEMFDTRWELDLMFCQSRPVNKTCALHQNQNNKKPHQWTKLEHCTRGIPFKDWEMWWIERYRQFQTYIPHPVVTTTSKYKATHKARGEQNIFECTYKY